MAAPKAFLSTRRVSSEAASAELTQHATRFLRRVAHDMRLSSREFDIKATHATARRRQYITLSTESFFLDVQDTAPGTTVAISYRTRQGKLDLSGGRSNSIAVEQIDTAQGYASLVLNLRLTQGLSNARRDSRSPWRLASR
jgi:hypothetical protein